MRRAVLGFGLVLLLAACDEQARDDVPAAVERPPRPAAEEGAPPSLRISVPPIEPAGKAKPPVEISLPEPAERTPEPSPAAEPSPPKRSVEEVELAAPKLDLSLPEAWPEALEEPSGEPPATLLPPMFGPPEGPAVHMSGRLIPGEQESEQAIDGAEIQFEFRR
ncbi:hypothetical protein [Stutzerimonas balearica]|uniref:hypothetical protein n=1 Tax=Stutzerimonas balearica TaxID=74829 RepID=UPI0028AFCB22|nr:hypothetical protein [Stutzerimonas balearica]